METESVLVEYETKDVVSATSGTLIHSKYIIITPSVCMPILEENLVIDNINKIKSGLQEPSCIFKTNEYIFNVVIGENIHNKHLNKYSEFKETKVFKQAKIKAVFSCDNIKKSFKKHLSDWSSNEEDKPINALISVFFILEFIEFNTNLHDIKKELILFYNNIIKNCDNDYRIGDKVSIESAAFGNRFLINTYTEGIISNMFGIEQCFLLSDCSTVPGCDGSPVCYKSSKNIGHPLGIVISCLNWWNGDNLGLTLITTWISLLPQLLFNDCDKINYVKQINIRNSTPLLDTINKSIVQIVSGPCWGTAILIQKSNGIFLTNSHVIGNDSSITIYWKHMKIRAELIYKNKNIDDNYDLALVKCLPKYLNELKESSMVNIKINSTNVVVGNMIYAVASPIFSELHPQPTITAGNITQIHKNMLTTSCSVFPGCSGGTLLNSNGLLTGIIVSNVKTIDTKISYPKLNLSIPVCSFWYIIEEYLKTQNPQLLKKLKLEEHEERYWTFIKSNL